MQEVAPGIDEHRPASSISEPVLALTGHLPQPRRFSLADLLRLERRELGPTQVNCFSGRPVCSVQSYAGVRLTDVLDAAGFSTRPRPELKRCVVAATGLDGYRALFTWHELYNTAIGAGVLVLYECDGQPLGEPDDGRAPLSLISAHDRQLGPRRLKFLQSVHVLSL